MENSFTKTSRRIMAFSYDNGSAIPVAYEHGT
jgi:hypothetical protein